MKKTGMIFLTLLLFTAWGCKKEQLDNIDAIEFGYINFAWGADCQRYYIVPGRLSTTSQDCDPKSSISPQYDLTLSAEKYALAERLLEQLPEKIWDTPEGQYVTACADCGGYYIRIQKGDTYRSFYFEGAEDDTWPQAAKTTFNLLLVTLNDLSR